MASSAINRKVERIRQIVQLKQMMRRWKALSLRGRSQPVLALSDSEPDSTRPVRAGCLAVYVGLERRRFVIPTRFLNLPVFASLLERAEEEYGFQPRGGLALPCEVGFFRWVLDALGKNEERFKRLGLDGFLRLFSELGLDSSCKDGSGSIASSSNAFSPLLQKSRA